MTSSASINGFPLTTGNVKSYPALSIFLYGISHSLISSVALPFLLEATLSDLGIEDTSLKLALRSGIMTACRYMLATSMTYATGNVVFRSRRWTRLYRCNLYGRKISQLDFSVLARSVVMTKNLFTTSICPALFRL